MTTKITLQTLENIVHDYVNADTPEEKRYAFAEIPKELQNRYVWDTLETLFDQHEAEEFSSYNQNLMNFLQSMIL